MLENSGTMGEFFPYSEGAKLHLSERAAARLHGLWDRVYYPEEHKQAKPMLEVKADRVMLLADGWVRAFTHWNYNDDNVFSVDLLLAPGEVIAIEAEWNSKSGPGKSEWDLRLKRTQNDRETLWDKSWKSPAESPQQS